MPRRSRWTAGRLAALSCALLLVPLARGSAGAPATKAPPSDPLLAVDQTCNSDAIRSANEAYLERILSELTNTTYFRLFRVQLDGPCPLDAPSAPPDDSPACGADEDVDVAAETAPAAPLCQLDLGGGGGGGMSGLGIFGQALDTNLVDKTLSKREDAVLHQSEDDCDDENLPSFWTNLCAKLPFNGTVDYVNLQLNPEQYTGYNGSKVWAHIYSENCFDVEEASMCYEERFLHRMLSGLHSSINLHISQNFRPPVPGKRAHWERNLDRFRDQFDGHPERIQNLEFAFVVLLRAVRRAAPVLREFKFETGDTDEDFRTRALANLVLDAFVLRSCEHVFEAFDESLLFVHEAGAGGARVSTMSNLKRRFKGVFHNISSTFNCIRCQKCKLHGKLQLLGIGTALKILLLPEDMLRDNLSREEVVALFNTAQKFSEAIAISGDMKQAAVAALRPPRPAAQPTGASASAAAAAATTAAAAAAAGPSGASVPPAPAAELSRELGLSAAARVRGSDADLDAVVDALLDGDADVLALARHFAAADAAAFVRHAARRLGRANLQSPQQMQQQQQQQRKQPVLGEDVPADVVVVGAGLSGLTVALSVLDRGGTVVLVDKEALAGGNSAKASSGINGIDERSVRELDDSVARFKADVVAASEMPEYEHNPLVDALTQGSVEALQWLRERVGLALPHVGQLGGHARPRTWRPAAGLAGAELVSALGRAVKRAAQARGPGAYRFVPRARVTALLRADGGGAGGGGSAAAAVTGVRVQLLGDGDDSGAGSGGGGGAQVPAELELRAGAVVLATGGYGFHRGTTEPPLLGELRPDLMRFPTTNGRFATGDGVRLAQTAGADTVDLSEVQLHPTAFVDPADPQSPVKTLAAELLRGLGAVMLARDGARFVDELDTRRRVSAAMLAKAGDAAPEFVMALSAAAAARAPKHVPMYLRKGLMSRLPDEAALAAFVGAPEAAVRAALADLDASARDPAGHPDAFNRTVFPPEPLLGGGPFVAGVITPAVHYSMGGLRVDADGRVLGSGGAPVGGGRLLAVGETVGGIHGRNRLGGNALTECAVLGRRVGTTLPLRVSSLVSTRGSAGTMTGGSASDAGTASGQAPEGGGLRAVSAAELAAHARADDCWVAIEGKVYDFTAFAQHHPAGAEAITQLAGRDGTREFLEVHTVSLLEDFDPVGQLQAQ